MQLVRQWALTVAVSAVIGAVIYMRSPSGTAGKGVKTAVSLFMLLAMLSPFAKSVDASDFDFETPGEINQTDMSEAVKNQMKTEVEMQIRKILEENGIYSAAINIDININSENVMTVERIEISVRNAENGNILQAEKKIKSEIGADVRIGVVN